VPPSLLAADPVELELTTPLDPAVLAAQQRRMRQEAAALAAEQGGGDGDEESQEGEEDEDEERRARQAAQREPARCERGRRPAAVAVRAPLLWSACVVRLPALLPRRWLT
jgi:hypothetical protein